MTKESIHELRARLASSDQVQAMIRTRAYQIYQTRGGWSGNPQHDWLQAENEVLMELIEVESRSGVNSNGTADSAAAPASLEVKPKKTRGASAKVAASRKTKSKSSTEKERKKKKSTKANKAREAGKHKSVAH